MVSTTGVSNTGIKHKEIQKKQWRIVTLGVKPVKTRNSYSD